MLCECYVCCLCCVWWVLCACACVLSMCGACVCVLCATGDEGVVLRVCIVCVCARLGPVSGRGPCKYLGDLSALEDRKFNNGNRHAKDGTWPARQRQGGVRNSLPSADDETRHPPMPRAACMTLAPATGKRRCVIFLPAAVLCVVLWVCCG